MGWRSSVTVRAHNPRLVGSTPTSTFLGFFSALVFFNFMSAEVVMGFFYGFCESLLEP